MTGLFDDDAAELIALRDEVALLIAAALRANAAQLAEAERVEHHHADQIADMEIALTHRDLIGQAKGVIMATMNCSSDEAFDLLVKQSQHENRKLIVIATEIADRADRRNRPRAPDTSA
jgi:ANTAR domain